MHCILSNKGGIGKTVVSNLLTQYLMETGIPVQAIDTDPVNHTLASYPGLHCREVQMLTDGTRLNGKELDGLAHSLLTDDVNFVIDNGAASFVPFGDYLEETDFHELLTAHGKELVLHAVLAGGEMIVQCILAMNTLLTAFPSSVKVVVWLNEHFGPVELDGKSFEDMQIYGDNISRIAGIVRLRALSPLFLRDYLEMQKRKATFAEILQAPGFHIMNQQRIVMIRRAIWQQLEAVI